MVIEMDLEMIIFTVLEAIILFVAVYFFFTNIKIRGESRNSYPSILGKLLYFTLFISLMIGAYYSGSLNDLLLSIIFLQVALIPFYRKSFDSILLYLGVAVTLISDLLLLYVIFNPSQPLIFSYALLVALIFYTVIWAIMVVEKIRGRTFSLMDKLSGTGGNIVENH